MAKARWPSRIAIVHDWLYTYAGAERVLEQVIDCFPHADIFSLIDCVPDQERAFLKGKAVNTSFLQHFPFRRRLYQKYLPFMPAAIESLDLRDYELVISSSSAVARGVLTQPHQLHVCYLQSRSLRYLYDERFSYLPSRLLIPLQAMLMSPIRTWDYIASHRPDATIANSNYVKRWHQHRYGIESDVIHPPVNAALFAPYFRRDKEDYYVVVSRFERYKQVPIVIEAFNRLGRRLVVVGAGSEKRAIQRIAHKNVDFVGRLAPADVAKVMAGARALVFAGREDFGISFVEAQAAGTAVVAFGQGGAVEIVRGLEGAQPTGMLFNEQSVDAVMAAVMTYEQNMDRISPEACRENSARFSPDRFRREFTAFVETKWSAFQAS